jgi:hypothetical protein
MSVATAPPFPMALDLLFAVEYTAKQAEYASVALSNCCLDSKRLEDIESGSVDRLQDAICRLETAATHLHHITQR